MEYLIALIACIFIYVLLIMYVLILAEVMVKPYEENEIDELYENSKEYVEIEQNYELIYVDLDGKKHTLIKGENLKS